VRLWQGATRAASPRAAATDVEVVVTMVPNDKVLRAVVCDEETGILAVLKGVHVSCSTVHPDTSRELAKLHVEAGSQFVGAPIFARADGVAQRLASFCVGGAPAAVDAVLPLLEANSNGIFRFGEDPGAGNVVKVRASDAHRRSHPTPALHARGAAPDVGFPTSATTTTTPPQVCGNFLIASTIEACGEACSLAEKSGLDRVAVMEMLNTTIFDCLIYKGYGNRVAQRSHVPGEPLVGPGFALELGLKDVSLALDVAAKVQAPMPFASTLRDRFASAAARGRGSMDWSAIALSISEDAGVDVTQWLPPKSPPSA
tara:strand:- start:1747 stop:2688 length:942 start_codon:yes stop_codon:yes gene_type:complete